MSDDSCVCLSDGGFDMCISCNKIRCEGCNSMIDMGK